MPSGSGPAEREAGKGSVWHFQPLFWGRWSRRQGTRVGGGRWMVLQRQRVWLPRHPEEDPCLPRPWVPADAPRRVTRVPRESCEVPGCHRERQGSCPRTSHGRGWGSRAGGAEGGSQDGRGHAVLGSRQRLSPHSEKGPVSCILRVLWTRRWWVARRRLQRFLASAARLELPVPEAGRLQGLHGRPGSGSQRSIHETPTRPRRDEGPPGRRQDRARTRP